MPSISVILLMFLLVSPGFATAKVQIQTNSQTKLKSYRLEQGGFKLELVQRLPDQTRAFFMARGFSKEVANDIGLSCVFQTIGTNVSDKTKQNPIEVSLKNWLVIANNKTQKVKMKETWDKQWPASKVSKAARIAFKWATFPGYQNYSNSGDYGWGMISFDLPPQTFFDLKVTWKENNKPQQAWIRSVECPPDR